MSIVIFPGTFAEALASPTVSAGDRLLLRAGTYTGNFTVNTGVTIQPYGNEAVVVDGSITLAVPNIKLIDMEITDSNPDLTQTTNGITMNYPGCELIGCYIHDLHNSGVSWFGSGAGRIAECMIYNNGYMVESVGHGHAIYTHNNTGGARVIERNLLLDQIGNYALQIYSGGNNWLQDYTVRDNVTWGNPTHIGGGLGVKNLLYENNIHAGDYAQIGRYSPEGENYDATIRGNWFIGMSSYLVEPFQQLTETGNLVWGGEPANRAGYTVEAAPANWSKLIPFSLSGRWSGLQVTITDGVFSAAMVAT
jgi:hypothetical protein